MNRVTWILIGAGIVLGGALILNRVSRESHVGGASKLKEAPPAVSSGGGAPAAPSATGSTGVVSPASNAPAPVASAPVQSPEDRFLARYPGKKWKFNSVPGTGWVRLRGDQLDQYKKEAPLDAALHFLRDHPELLEGIPPEATLAPALDRLQKNAMGSFVPVKAEVNGVAIPTNRVVEIDPQGRVRGASRNGPDIHSVQVCESVPKETAEATVARYLSQSSGGGIRIQTPKTSPTFWVVGGGRAFSAWNVYAEGASGGRVLQAVVSACDGSIVKAPLATGQD